MQNSEFQQTHNGLKWMRRQMKNSLPSLRNQNRTLGIFLTREYDKFLQDLSFEPIVSGKN